MTDALMPSGAQFGKRLKPAFAESVVFHVALVGGLVAWAYFHPSISLGDPHSGAPMIGIETLSTIPLPSHGPDNPVANDSKSEVPQEKIEKEKPEKVKPVHKEAIKPEPADAILVPTPKKRPLRPKSELPSLAEIEKNQLTSKSPQSVSSRMFQAKGTSQIGSSIDAVMGSQFGEYAARVKDITSRRWHDTDLDRSTIGIPVTVRFTIHKDGSVTGFQFVRRSTIATLDDSAKDAVLASYPPLPDGYPKNSAEVEFTFEVKR